MHKTKIHFRHIVSACGTSTCRLATYLNKILQHYCGNNFSFVKDSKSLAESLKEWKVALDEGLVSFNDSVLFTSIQVPVADIIKRKFMEHSNEKGTEDFLEKNLFHP